MAKSGARRQSPLAPGGIAHNIESEPELEGDSMADPTNSTDAQRNRSDGDNWPGIPLVGLGIVIVGAVFLARNFGWDFPLPDRWWAIFILIPAAAALVSAARYFRVDGRVSSRAIGSATAGVLMLATALILFLDLDWGQVWPIMVIIVGLGILWRGTARR
jgi:phosphatidylserine synthase